MPLDPAQDAAGLGGSAFRLGDARHDRDARVLEPVDAGQPLARRLDFGRTRLAAAHHDLELLNRLVPARRVGQRHRERIPDGDLVGRLVQRALILDGGALVVPLGHERVALGAQPPGERASRGRGRR